jgi:hypothetical protein
MTRKTDIWNEHVASESSVSCYRIQHIHHRISNHIGEYENEVCATAIYDETSANRSVHSVLGGLSTGLYGKKSVRGTSTGNEVVECA